MSAQTEPQHPPPYSPPAGVADANFGFPFGYFVIGSVATGRLMDVELDSVEDGAEIILWPEKETSLVEGFRKPEADNQVFFIDTTGALCSRMSGHAIDVEDGRLVQRHRRPLSYPFPNAFSHPLPQFRYSPSSKQISVCFTSDPSYPPHDANNPLAAGLQQTSYILSSVPVRKPRTLLEDASEVLNNVIINPLSPLTSLFGSTSKATVQEVHNSGIDLREDEVLEEDRAEEEEADDSPEPLRKIAMLAVRDNEEGLTEATKRRRIWEVVPLRRARAQYTR